MAEAREVAEGRQIQGVDEQIAYSITTTNWGASPTTVSVVVKDETDALKDVTSMVMSTGSPTVAGDVISLPILKSLTNGHIYRVEVKFTSGGNVYECFFYVDAQL